MSKMTWEKFYLRLELIARMNCRLYGVEYQSHDYDYDSNTLRVTGMVIKPIEKITLTTTVG